MSNFVLPPGMTNDQVARLAAQAAQGQMPGGAGMVPQAQMAPPEPVDVVVTWRETSADGPLYAPEAAFDEVVVSFTPSGVVLRRPDGSAIAIGPSAYIKLEINRRG